MNDAKRIQGAFELLQPSMDCLQKLRKIPGAPARKRRRFRPSAAAVLAAVLLLISPAAFAIGTKGFFILNGSSVAAEQSADGSTARWSVSDYESDEARLIWTDGRLWYQEEELRRDITEEISNEIPWVASYEDQDGNTHVIGVGGAGTAEGYSWIEVILDENGNSVTSFQRWGTEYDPEAEHPWEEVFLGRFEE